MAPAIELDVVATFRSPQGLLKLIPSISLLGVTRRLN